MLQELSVEEVRTFLESLGVEANQLAQLSDEEVMALYQEALGQAATELQNSDISAGGAEETEEATTTP